MNDPLSFISFIAEHRLGEQLEGEVEGYTSHGAVVRVGDMRCYVPLANLGDPPPRSAREVLKRHERATFVLTALDPQRRGAELALPGIAHVSGHPLEETVEAEVRLAAKPPRKRAGAQGTRRAELGEPPVPTAATPPPGRRRPGHDGTVAAAPVSALSGDAAVQPAKKEPAKKEPTKKATAKKSAAKNQPVKKATAKKAASLQQGGRRERPASVARAEAPSSGAHASPASPPRKAAASKPPTARVPAASKPATAPVPAASKKSVAPAKQPATKGSGRSSKTAAAPAQVAEVAAPRSTKAAADKAPSARKSPRAVKSAAAGGAQRR